MQSKFEVPDASEVEFGDISPLASKLSLIVGQLRRDRNGLSAVPCCCSSYIVFSNIRLTPHPLLLFLLALQVTLPSRLYSRKPPPSLFFYLGFWKTSKRPPPCCMCTLHKSHS